MRRRDALAVILDRAQVRGELPPHLPSATITNIVFGVIWYRLLATNQQLDDQLAGELVITLAGPQAGQADCSNLFCDKNLCNDLPDSYRFIQAS